MIEKFKGEGGKKEVYEKMLEKRGSERHKEISKEAKRKSSFEERIKTIEET
jgi:hypothetical protein